jgi:hypothetical protein
MDAPKTLEVTYDDYTCLPGTSHPTLEERLNLFDRLIWKLIAVFFATGKVDLAGGFFKVRINNETLDKVMRQK